jgi:PAT family beta-lactamase induction signal transducer AmpG
LFVSQVAFNFMATFLPIFTVQALKWTDLQYSSFFSTASLIGGIGGMLIGGILIEKFGKIRMLNFYFSLLLLLSLGLSFSNVYWEKYWLIGCFMTLYQILYVFTCIGIFSVAMEFCWKKVSASQFTLYMTLGNLGRLLGAKIIGPIKEQFDWNHAILSFSILIAAAWIAMQFLDVSKQLKSIKLLESS